MPPEVPHDHPIPDFNRTQLHVLQILWEADAPLKAIDIEERFDWAIDNATLRSVLKVLIDKGEVERERQGKAFLYRSTMKKQHALSKMISGLAEIFAGGSRSGLVAQLLQDGDLSDAERAELEKIARDNE